MLPDSDLIAYAAGLIEGEGSFALSGGSYPRFQMSMVDREPLEILQAIIGGTINGPYQQQRENHRPYWQWQYGGWQRFAELAERLRPWLSRRRMQQIDTILGKMPAPRVETPECGLPPCYSAVHAHRKKGEPACKTCREWNSKQAVDARKARRSRRPASS